MYRLPEVAAAIGLAQLEKIDLFVEKRVKMAELYIDVINSNRCEWLKIQEVPKNDYNCYYTFAMRYQKNDIPWCDFRKKYISNGGDGIFAAWSLCYQEDSIPEILSRLKKMHLGNRFNTNLGICPVAETIQKELMQLTTNQKDINEMNIQADALDKTIKYFN